MTSQRVFLFPSLALVLLLALTGCAHSPAPGLLQSPPGVSEEDQIRDIQACKDETDPNKPGNAIASILMDLGDAIGGFFWPVGLATLIPHVAVDESTSESAYRRCMEAKGYSAASE